MDNMIKKYTKTQSERSKKYYEKNKVKVLEKCKEVVHCEYCNLKMNKSSYVRHKKGKMHLLKVELSKSLDAKPTS